MKAFDYFKVNSFLKFGGFCTYLSLPLIVIALNFDMVRSRTYTRFGGGLKIICFLACMLQNGTMDKHLKKKISFPTKKCLLLVFHACARQESSKVSKRLTLSRESPKKLPRPREVNAESQKTYQGPSMPLGLLIYI